MNIQQFAAEYCKDLQRAAKRRAELFADDYLYYDEIIEDIDGTRVRVVNTDNYSIPIMDIITAMDREEFAKQWPYAECLEAYDNYISNICIVDGPEVFREIQARMAASLNAIHVDEVDYDYDPTA